ncbi:MAG: hypothetical protein A3K19_27855 [Lentisphaerae bacterium RIFOXYB12_FULL_65_16]|nr:MAG: hypothetical protein A3K18_25860 [Lentisphaerae bacterium RIFOXYA12_64_32]OGV88179.1 MAG: hypothetical protein A3K19_27855 [Lentisphaerae bacterium RIFOXYB12_FULL_65_16]
MTVENDCLKYEVSTAARNVLFADRSTGVNYVATPATTAVALIRKAGKTHPATAAAYADGKLTVTFGETGVTAVIKVTIEKRYLVFEVEKISDATVESFTFAHIPLSVKVGLDETFAGCAVSLNLLTNVPEIPGPNKLLRAMCDPRFGVVGARVAIVGCPMGELRNVLQEVVSAAPDLPHSSISGPWALDAPINYGSYLFDTGQMSEQTVDEWIRLCQRLGVNQIDFHGGTSFRFGDCEPNPKLYPNGKASFKAVIDKLHAAGIVAGLHTYAFFMAKNCPWVTPVPDPRLGKDVTFTLAADLAVDVTEVPVDESTKDVSNITGFFVRNSVTIQVDDELITYTDVTKAPPYAFTGCKRGAYGTRVASHAKGAKVGHLKECFGLFTPDADSTLLAEVAAKTAEMYNECGFDMIYLDALDGEDILGGWQNSWHYGSKFVFEIWKRLNKPALGEMSTFHHHLWFARARMGAWDHPTRSHKRFIDIHCKDNESCARMFLPAHLGWWTFKPAWTGPQDEPTYGDDIEYLCGKAIGNNCGLSIMGINPSTINTVPALPRLAGIMKRYENLRQANYFTPEVKDKLRVPGDEYALSQGQDGEWQFHPVRYDKHKVVGLDGWSNTWTATNKFERQPLQLRIEALMSAGPYDAPGNVTLADYTASDAFPVLAAQPGITGKLESSTAQVRAGTVSGLFSATNTTETSTKSWCKLGKTDPATVDLSGHQALGVWVYGDGKGEVLNLQQTSPPHLSHGIADHYIVVDFIGWRYFELIEPEGERYADYSWPYGGIYSIYRESIRPGSVNPLSFWFNNIPPKDAVSCYLSPVKALPTVKTKLRNPSVTVGGKTITFPVEIETGGYLEFRSPTDCKLYAPSGELIAEVTPQGDVPDLDAGANAIRFACEPDAGVTPRAYVSVISRGEVLRGRNPVEQINWSLLQREDDDPRTVRALDGVQNEWDIACRADAKSAKLEVELIVDSMGDTAALYSDPAAIPLEPFDTLDAFADTPANKYLQYVVSGAGAGVATSPGVTHELALASDLVKQGKTSARYTATSASGGGWSARGKRFDPPLDLSACTHIGFLIHGDGNREVVNVQLRDSKGAWHDMKVGIGFTGWKYQEFALAGAACDLAKIEYLIVYYNGLPAGKPCTCYLDDIRAFRDPTFLQNPSLTVADRKIVLPATLQAGSRLVYTANGECRTYGADGKQKAVFTAVGGPLTLKPGGNRVKFDMDAGTAPAFQVRISTTKVYE